MVDFTSWDNYPMKGAGNGDYVSAGLAHDLIRSTKHQNFIVMEQQAGMGGTFLPLLFSLSFLISLFIRFFSFFSGYLLLCVTRLILHLLFHLVYPSSSNSLLIPLPLTYHD